MRPEISRLASLIADVAARVEPEGSLAEPCRRLVSAPGQEILIAAEDLATAGIARDALGHPARTTTFASLAEESLEANASLLVGAFSSDALISGKAAGVVTSVFFPRPVSTYAFVFLESAKLSDPENRSRLSRAAWRLLVPDPKPAWSSQDLESKNIFLLEASRTFSLPNVFPVPEQDADRIARAFLEGVLFRLEERLTRSLARSGQQPAASRIEEARTELLSLRELTARRLDTAESQAGLAAQTRVQRLVQDLRPLVIQEATAASLGAARPIRARKEELLASWRQSLEADLQTRLLETAREVADLLQPAFLRPGQEPGAGAFDYAATLSDRWQQALFLPSVEKPGPGTTAGPLVLGAAGTLLAASRWLIPELMAPLVRSISPVLGILMAFGGWQLYSAMEKKRKLQLESNLRESLDLLGKELLESTRNAVAQAYSGLKSRVLTRVEAALAELAEQERALEGSTEGLPAEEIDLKALRNLRRLLAATR